MACACVCGWWLDSLADWLSLLCVLAGVFRYIQRSLGLKAVHVNVVGTEGCFEAKKEVAQAKPGAPSVKFV